MTTRRLSLVNAVAYMIGGRAAEFIKAEM